MKYFAFLLKPEYVSKKRSQRHRSGNSETQSKEVTLFNLSKNLHLETHPFIPCTFENHTGRMAWMTWKPEGWDNANPEQGFHGAGGRAGGMETGAR